MADEFDEFVNAGEVEVGKPEIESTKDGVATTEEKPKSKPPRQAEAPKKEAAKAPTGDEDDGEEGDEDEGGEEGDEDEKPKPKKSAAEHQIERLKREKRDLQRQLRSGGANSALEQRLASLETRLTGENSGGKSSAGKAAPDPSDTAKYPLGHLDDRYIEDKLEWLADQKATAQADSILQRQQEIERGADAEAQQRDLLEKVDDLSVKGSELFDDFQEEVVEAGMRGDWKLQQATFEACHEADNGAQILYELSQDPKEALRVSRLSNYQQMKFVQERDAEIGTGKKGRTKPKAGEPPKNTPRGANSKTQINPATENLNDFETAWKQDEKRSKG
jgi:hypothetical protein